MPDTVPESLSSMLGVAVRTAQRMGIHNEGTLSKYSILEAEMRRRLWWALVLFDARVGEMAGYNTASLGPQWTCKIPLNVNDSDLRPEMREPPEVQDRFTDATFPVVRSQIANFVRHAAFHLDFANPASKPLSQDLQDGNGQESCSKVDKMISSKYLRFCDPRNPLQSMTTCMTRSILARNYLMDHLSRYPVAKTGQTDAHRVARLSYALDMIRCDTQIITSPLTKGFCWLANEHFPFFAFTIIVQILMRNPRMKEADLAWEVISDHFEARFASQWDGQHTFVLLYSKVISRAWRARKISFKSSGQSLVVPRVVVAISRKLAREKEIAEEMGVKQSNTSMGVSMDDLSMPIQMPMAMEDHNWMHATGGGGGGYDSTGLDLCFGMPGQAMDIGLNSFDFGSMDWDALLADGAEPEPSSSTPPFLS